MIARVPNGAKGYLFQSYGPARISYADLVGLIRDGDGRRRLMESWTCGANLSHSWTGNSLSVVPKAAINLFKRLNRSFRRIDSMVVWFDQLKCASLR